MLWEVFRFEVRYHLQQPIFWIGLFFFSLITFLAVTTDAVVLGGSIGQIHRNAPYVIMQMLLINSFLGVFVTTAFVAGAVVRDQELNTQELFFSSRLGKREYLLGRFGGALAVSILLNLGAVIGIVTGSLMPWLEAERVGPFSVIPYLHSFLILVVPNTFLTACIFFGLATLTRSMVSTYVGVVGMLTAYAIAENFLYDLENEGLAVVLDPFGAAAFTVSTKYWTVAEKNSQLLELAGPFLTNRLLWMGVASTILLFTWWRFSFQLKESRKRRRQRVSEETDADFETLPAPVTVPPTRIAPDFSRSATIGRFFNQTAMEIHGVLRSPAFFVILGFGVLNMIANSSIIDQIYGTPIHPVTHLMIRILQGSFLFVFIIITFYSGELVWRERSFRVDEIYDALPVPNWLMWGAKTAALGFVIVSLLLVSIVTAVGIQAYSGYFNFEPGLYLRGMLLVVGVPLLLSGVLALFLQVVSNNKYLGFLLMIAYFISGPALSALDYDHNLYQYAGAPAAPYSDMNGFGHFVAPLFWFYLYWAFGAAILTVLIHLFWQRGSEESWRLRLQLARQRFTRPVAGATGVALLGFLATGAWIFINTNIFNEYVPDDLSEARQVRYEKEYKQFEGLPQPRIASVYADVDIYPERRALSVRGRYALINKTDGPIPALHLRVNPNVRINRIELPGSRLERADAELGYYIYRLEPEMPAGAAWEIGFDLAVETRGFVNSTPNLNLVYNGTFFNSADYFPHLGYSRVGQLTDPNDRRKHGLPALERMPSIDDEAARRNNYISNESDWIDFETVVSTSPDQIALAPGYLQREWTESGRRYFHYKMDAPILGFFAYLSARWEVTRDRWNDVTIEVYHHPSHAYNVERMIDSVKKSLDYFSTHFSPYQHRQVRIIEFPRYASFAQSFPNTIPFSESIGFIARLDDDEEAIDYVFYVTAHEVAHQWWAHQVIGGFNQGATVMSETMSQYSALMVMKQEYGPQMMRRFLKYELDNYLRSRGGELLEELPLLLVENQPYIHYRKGSVVMYALQDYLGEDVLNRALADYVEAVKFQQPPYTTSREFLSFVRRAAPPENQALLTDLFESITLYENRALSARSRTSGDGRFSVRIEVEAAKFRSDGQGREESVPIDDWVDVGVFGEKGADTPPEGKVLILKRVKVSDSKQVFELVVDEKPLKAGIDPFNKLIDRSPENNIVAVEQADG